MITQIATGGLKPDVTIYLDLPVSEGLDRKRTAAGHAYERSPLDSEYPSPIPTDEPPGIPAEWNRLDAREIAFHERVQSGYRALMAAEPQRWLSFDGHLDQDILAAMIWQQLESYLSAYDPAAG